MWDMNFSLDVEILGVRTVGDTLFDMVIRGGRDIVRGVLSVSISVSFHP